MRGKRGQLSAFEEINMGEEVKFLSENKGDRHDKWDD